MRLGQHLCLFILWLNVEGSLQQTAPQVQVVQINTVNFKRHAPSRRWGADLKTFSLLKTGCGRPPPLLDGDVTGSIETHYREGESVEYTCNMFHVVAGGPYKTCINGQWTGEIKCMKPCTVNEDDMKRQNVRYRYVQRKVYMIHNDVISFLCTRGRPVRTEEMRQRCSDGVIQLPTCV